MPSSYRGEDAAMSVRRLDRGGIRGIHRRHGRGGYSWYSVRALVRRSKGWAHSNSESGQSLKSHYLLLSCVACVWAGGSQLESGVGGLGHSHKCKEEARRKYVGVVDATGTLLCSTRLRDWAWGKWKTIYTFLLDLKHLKITALNCYKGRFTKGTKVTCSFKNLLLLFCQFDTRSCHLGRQVPPSQPTGKPVESLHCLLTDGRCPSPV